MKLDRNKINFKMAENCMNVVKLAEVYGVSRTRMQIILNQQKVTSICAGRLAKALKCSVAEIIETEK